MRIDVITLFPELVHSVADCGVTGRAVSQGLVKMQTWNPRDFADNRHNSVDERAYGGGPGMVMQIAPLRSCLQAVRSERGNASGPVIAMTPQGEKFDQAWARRLAQGGGATLICGRYEGMDERLLESEIDFELSIGDFVLSGGELPAMVVIDALARLQPGALGHEDSAEQDSFSEGLLDHPHYTRPACDDAAGDVPEVLLSGDHAAINRWRLKQALGRTWLRRPDLLDSLVLDDDKRRLLEEFVVELPASAKKAQK